MNIIDSNQPKPEIVERRSLPIYQELEQKVCLETLKNQTRQQQKALENHTSELRQLFDLEQIRKRSIKQLDQLIRIKKRKIAELGRQELARKRQLDELLQKVNLQKQNCNFGVTQINAEEEKNRLKNVEDNRSAFSLEVAQKEAEKPETTRKECELDLGQLKKSKGYSKLKKINKQKLIQNYLNLQQNVSMPADQQSLLKLSSNQTFQSFVDVEQCVPPKKPLTSALPAQSSQLARQHFYNQQKFKRQRMIVQHSVNSNLSINSTEFENSGWTTTTTILPTLTCVIPEMVQSSSSPSEPTSSCPVLVNLINTGIDQCPNSTNALSKSTFDQTVTPVTSNLFIPKTFTLAKSSITTSPPISTVASTSTNSFTTTSKFASSLTSTYTFVNSSTSTSSSFNLNKSLPIYSNLIPSTTTFNLLNSSPPLSPVTTTLADSSTSTSPSFPANLDNTLNLDNGIEIITIDDLDSGTIEDNETSKSINQIQKNFSTIDELIDVNHICGNDIASVETTAVVVKPMDNFENELTESTDKIFVDLVPETSIQNLDLSNDSDSVDDQFELVGGQNDNQQQKLTSKSNNRQQIKAQRRGCREYYKLRNNKKRKESLEQCRDYYFLRKRQPTLQQNEEEPEQQQQNSQTSSELNEMGQNGKLRYDTDIDNRATLKSKENGRGRKRKINGGGVETSEQSNQFRRERLLAQKREWMKQRRANETPEERKRRLEQKREYDKQKIANETSEERERRLTQKRDRRANETPKERERRLVYLRAYDKVKIANETVEERESRLVQKRERIANETSEQREHRLAQKREYEKQKIEKETPEQQKCRLAKQRVKQNNYINRKKQQS